MGAWGRGPFDNDAAADFIDELQSSPSRFVAKALTALSNEPTGKYLEIDDGGKGWACCELTALAFGRGDTSSIDDSILDIIAKLKPKEEHRKLALEVLPRLADRSTSELSALWHEGTEGAKFDAAIENLRARLEDASSGPRELPKPKIGDVIALAAETGSNDLVVVQVVGTGEVAVFEGIFSDQQEALAAVKARPARRIPTSVNKLLRRGKNIGNTPPRKELRGKKFYAGETGAIKHYVIATANAGGARIVSYDEACDHDLLRPHDENAIRSIARGTYTPERVRSPDAREAELRARNASEWAERVRTTNPSPFGDVQQLERLLKWIEDYSIENALLSFHEEATGSIGYGRPREEAERRSYAFAGLVALWRKKWPQDFWPAELASRLPVVTDQRTIAQAVVDARVLASNVITRDAELWLIWKESENGAELRRWVDSLLAALE
jgi:hypothetical protein